MDIEIGINNGIKDPTYGYRNCNTSQMLIFSGCVKVTGSLYTRVLIRVKTILNHIDTRAFSPRYEGSCMVYRPEGYHSTNTIQSPYATCIKKM